LEFDLLIGTPWGIKLIWDSLSDSYFRRGRRMSHGVGFFRGGWFGNSCPRAVIGMEQEKNSVPQAEENWETVV
jgi:hypothetical protein